MWQFFVGLCLALNILWGALGEIPSLRGSETKYINLVVSGQMSAKDGRTWHITKDVWRHALGAIEEQRFWFQFVGEPRIDSALMLENHVYLYLEKGGAIVMRAYTQLDGRQAGPRKFKGVPRLSVSFEVEAKNRVQLGE